MRWRAGDPRDWPEVSTARRGCAAPAWPVASELGSGQERVPHSHPFASWSDFQGRVFVFVGVGWGLPGGEEAWAHVQGQGSQIRQWCGPLCPPVIFSLFSFGEKLKSSFRNDKPSSHSTHRTPPLIHPGGKELNVSDKTAELERLERTSDAPLAVSRARDGAYHSLALARRGKGLNKFRGSSAGPQQIASG